MSNWQSVFTSPSSVHAEIVKGVLESHGIAAVLVNKQDSFYKLGYLEVHVSQEQVMLALKIVENEITF
ncbi:putative signal transducing protein [Penaeicola halotolerans]|uniref:putative signal transducing protein n=1 Tax=Penaeicola halotolerans TaxID=2793196 RepID=UPI001CF891E5|nr:DUF2007 domain-containing protein [Penaeicola halotolerans]